MWDTIWHGASVATMQGDALGLVPNSAVAAERGRIGPADALPGAPETLAREAHDCAGGQIMYRTRLSGHLVALCGAPEVGVEPCGACVEAGCGSGSSRSATRRCSGR
jgi:hypothetical protein